MKVRKAITFLAVFAIIPLIQRIIEKIDKFSAALDRVAFKLGREL